MQRSPILVFFVMVAGCVFPLLAGTSQQSAPAAPAAPAAPVQPSATAPPAAQQPTIQRNTLAVAVVDPAHGGADAGARGSAGISESDVVLSFARLLRISLEAQGLRVILTRQANEDPSFDDRSKAVNAQRGAIFISLHVSSTGPPGTVRVYSLSKDTVPASAESSGGSRPRLTSWDHAQQSYLDASRKLAELVQTEMAQRFHGSPATPATAAVRQLRTLMAPAIAIEVSSVSVPDRAPLDQMAPILADGVAHAVAAYRPIYEAEVK